MNDLSRWIKTDKRQNKELLWKQNTKQLSQFVGEGPETGELQGMLKQAATMKVHLSFLDDKDS